MNLLVNLIVQIPKVTRNLHNIQNMVQNKIQMITIFVKKKQWIRIICLLLNLNIKFSLEHSLDLANLKSTPVSLLYSISKDRIIILKEFNNKSGIYIIHNNVNGKQSVGSGMDLGKRLSTYYFPSRLADTRYISNSLLEYRHGSFSVVILHIWGITGSCKKNRPYHQRTIY